MFGISVFRSPEHFIGLALGLTINPSAAVGQLNELANRTKNPPISIIYTRAFLQNKSDEEHGLDIVRFISQLSDLSEGVSVASSLRDVIGESSLLT